MSPITWLVPFLIMITLFIVVLTNLNSSNELENTTSSNVTMINTISWNW